MTSESITKEQLIDAIARLSNNRASGVRSCFSIWDKNSDSDKIQNATCVASIIWESVARQRALATAEAKEQT
jgi:hypothetical protein